MLKQCMLRLVITCVHVGIITLCTVFMAAAIKFAKSTLLLRAAPVVGGLSARGLRRHQDHPRGLLPQIASSSSPASLNWRGLDVAKLVGRET